MQGVRTLLTASSGGHLAELQALAPRLPFDPGEVTWFTPPGARRPDSGGDAEVRTARDAPPRAVLPALANAAVVAAMFRRRRFDAVVSTGASLAVSSLPVARSFGAAAYYVESAARVDGPSLSGRLVSAVPGVRTFTQSPRWADRRWPYAGSVFDSFRPGPSAPNVVHRIVVTVGSQSGYPFDRLVTRLARVIDPATETLWQTGSADTTGLGIAAHASVPAPELDRAMAAADVVVAHAGVGSALAAVSAGRHPVLVPRRLHHGEHVDDHQVEVARELQERGLATCCDADEIDLDVLQEAASRRVSVDRSAPPLQFGSG